MAEFDDLDQQFDQLNQGLGQSTQMMAAFTTEMGKFQTSVSKTGYDLNTLERGLSKGLRGAFDGLVLDGGRLSDALRGLGMSIANTAYNAAVKPVTDHLGGMLAQGINGILGGMLPFANGGVISQGQVTPFAKGGVLDGPTTFPMRGGVGLMGEAGPEAIMPLKRGADGRLGVAGGGGKSIHVTMNISTPDAAGFQRSQSQIAAQMRRAMGRGDRNS